MFIRSLCKVLCDFDHTINLNSILPLKKKEVRIIINLFISLIVFSFGLQSQSSNFNISLVPVEIPELGGIQSFAFGQYDGMWLLVGGRLDGLHRRQPWATFDEAGNNKQFIVVDPESAEKWTADLNLLPISIKEHLSSTNIEFIQEGEYLYCLGGYGYSPTIGDHTTYSYMTAIHLPGIIDAIKNKENVAPFVRQVSDTEFQVTGGRLRKIYDKYYLLGGQKFIGRYNPMGPDHGPGFIQEYTNAVRIFTIEDDGETIIIKHFPSHIDSVNLHRRDYNAEVQILPNGEEAVTMFSGVFQVELDLPFLNSVTIDSSGYYVNNDFNQYYNHYHCPVVPLYSESEKSMHSIFFGGIAQFYDEGGVLIQDNDVPFVTTIARVTRDSTGEMAEYKLPGKMPALLGAGAEFIPMNSVPQYENGVFKLDEIQEDNYLMGYIFGGISSSDKNIFWINNGTESEASSMIYKVYLSKSSTSVFHNLNEQSVNSLQLKVYPNPTGGAFSVLFNLEKDTPVKLTISTIDGKVVKQNRFEGLGAGKMIISQLLDVSKLGEMYIVTVETSYDKVSQCILVGDM